MSGDGWTCTLNTLTCTRSDTLLAGTSYPPITLLVDVASDAPSGIVTNEAAVSGGGDQNTANNTSIDPALISGPSSSTFFVNDFTSTTLRNNYGDFVGMAFTVGPRPMTVYSLSRMFAPGNTGTHLVKLVQASDGSDVPGGSVSISMTGGTPGQFKLAPLAHPLALRPNTTYFLVSQETLGGDQWYDAGHVDTTNAATVNGPVYAVGSNYVTPTGYAGQSYGPVSFQYQ